MSNAWAEHKCKYCGRDIGSHDPLACKKVINVAFTMFYTTKLANENGDELNEADVAKLLREAFEAGFRAAFEEVKNA